MKRTEFGLGIIGALVIVSIVVGIVFPLDDSKDDELRAARQALDASKGRAGELEAALTLVRGELDEAETALAETEEALAAAGDSKDDELRAARQALDASKGRAGELEAALTLVRGELDEAETALAETEEALAAAPAQPEPIHREGGTWMYSDKITARARSLEYWGSTISALESRVSIEAEGDFALADSVPTLVVTCQADGARRVEFENIDLAPYWSEQIEQHEYDVSYQVTPAIETLPTGERGAQWIANQEFDFVDHWSMSPNLHNLVYLQLKQTERIELALTGLDGEQLELTFVVAGAFETRIQPNLDRCGEYY